MNKKITSKYDKCSHILVITNAFEKDNEIIYRHSCAKCKLDESVLDKNIDTLTKDQLEQKKYLLKNKGYIPGIYIPKYCSNIDELNKEYEEFISKTKQYNDEDIIKKIKKEIKIMDTLSYLAVKGEEAFAEMKREHEQVFDNCNHIKIVTGISRKTGKPTYGCPKCCLDERLLEFDREEFPRSEQIIYDYLKAGKFNNRGRKLNIYFPYIANLHKYYKNLNLKNTVEDDIIAEKEMTGLITRALKLQERLMKK